MNSTLNPLQTTRGTLAASFALSLLFTATASGTPVPRTLPVTPIAMSDSVTQLSGTLSATAPRLENKPTDLYAIRLGANEVVEISMNGAFDTYLRLRGPGIDQSNDDGGEGNNARLMATAPAEGGIYQLHATGYRASETGEYQLVIRRLMVSPEPRTAPSADELPTVIVPIPPGPPRPITPSLIHRGTLNAQSQQIDGKPADSYTIELSPNERIEIAMNANFDTYLKLEGPHCEQSDDDSGEGNNARLITSVSGGRYTIRAMSYRPGATGSYELRITRLMPTGEVAFYHGQLNSESPRDGSGKAYAEHQITANVDELIIMKLIGDFDTFLSVYGAGGHWADDDSGGNNSASLTLSPSESGPLSVYATAYDPDRYGAYRLSVQRVRQISGGTLLPLLPPTE